MSVRKKRGSYYTPDFLANFMMKYLAPNFRNRKHLSFLEPSVGDGKFIGAFNNTEFPKSIESFSCFAVEKIKPELDKSKSVSELNRKPNTKYYFKKDDFLKYQSNIKRKYSLIAGNPPYIKKNLLNKTQIDICKQIHNDAGLPESSVKNIWSSFVISCTNLLEEDGILAFVLPAELLQVKFSSSLRTYLSQQFERIETFTFDELLFHQIGQDTVLLICYKKSKEGGLYFTHINDRKQLQEGRFTLSKNDALLRSEIKGTHHSLTSDEITLVTNLKSRINTIPHFCNSRPGVVTAANEFFIVDEHTEAEYELQEYTSNIIQKGLFVNGSVVFDKSDLKVLCRSGLPSKLLCFPEQNFSEFEPDVQGYLRKGTRELVHKRYKCLKRTKWFVVPNIAPPPDGFFFKLSHFYPKLLKNNAQVLVTDSAYRIEMKNEYEIESFIFSFYNSLTLAFAEIEGRYYGGGVLELTPSEFKNLPLPYMKKSIKDFSTFREIFENKSAIEDVLKVYDVEILGETLNMSLEEIEKVQNIRNKLITKRLRK